MKGRQGRIRMLISVDKSIARIQKLCNDLFKSNPTIRQDEEVASERHAEKLREGER